MNKKNQQSTKH